MSLAIASEIGRLRSVMIHRPGLEIDRMVPSMMEELLFDDILYGDRAREEHLRLQRLIEFVADEVVLVRDLLVEVLGDADARRAILDELRAATSLPDEVLRELDAAEPAELAGHLIEGIVRPNVSALPADSARLYLLTPVPNLFFQRDPAVVIGDRVAISTMATEARAREPLIASWVFRHHPRFRDADGQPPLLDGSDEATDHRARPPSIEGGDVLVAREDILLVGVSARTERGAIRRLATQLKQRQSPIRKILLVDIPKARSFMHLDTVFTLVDRDACLVYEPAVAPGGVEEVDVYQVDLEKREVSYTAKDSLLDALAGAGMELTPIRCGGEDPIAQQREQWTDGANAFALAPGVILCYERNVRTAEELARIGWEVVYEDDLLLGKREVKLTDGKRYAIMCEGHELSRARGGPRCMTMPLQRDPL